VTIKQFNPNRLTVLLLALIFSIVIFAHAYGTNIGRDAKLQFADHLQHAIIPSTKAILSPNITRHRVSTSTRWHFAFGAMLS